MIKFFRKIRQHLLSENRFSKYLLYAIGEILLVVIGILIALQINNWNQNNIDRKKEITHLENILNNLNDDLHNQITPCIEKTKKQIDAFKLLQSGFFVNNEISNDSIRQLFYQNLSQWDLVLNTVAFDNLKSTGMNIISNDSIKFKLLTIYGNNYKYVNELRSDYDRTHNDRVTKLFFRNKVNLLDNLSNEEKSLLKQDKELLLGMELEASYILAKYLRELVSIKSMSEELIVDLKMEIQRLKKK